MAEAVSGTSPLQVLRPPRVLDELSGRIDQLAPTAVNDYARVWQRSVPPSAFSEYVGDFWQRSVLFLDILRERGNQHQDMLAHGVSLKNRTRKPPLRERPSISICPSRTAVSTTSARWAATRSRTSASSLLPHAFRISTTPSIRPSCSLGSRW